jgi:hypothetical protein
MSFHIEVGLWAAWRENRGSAVVIGRDVSTFWQEPEWPFDLPNFLSKSTPDTLCHRGSAWSWNGRLPHSDAEVKNAEVCTSSHSHIFRALCLSKHEITLERTCIVRTIQSSDNWTCNPNLTTYHSQQVKNIQSRFYTKIKCRYWCNLPVTKETNINVSEITK